MNFEDLDLFRRLVLAGSYLKLSESDKISKPKISRTLAALEEETGCRLLERQPGTLVIKLTEEGRILFDRIPAMLRMRNELLEAFQRSLSPGHEVTIHTTNLIIEDWLVPMLPALKEAFPDYCFNFIAQNTGFSPTELSNVATISPLTPPYEDLYLQHPIMDFDIRIWASEAYLKKYGTPERFEDLARHKILVFAKHFHELTYSTINWFFDSVKTKHLDLQVINSSPGMLEAATLGLGILSISKQAVVLRDLPLINILKEIPAPAVKMAFTFPAFWSNHVEMKKIADMLQNLFQERYTKALFDSKHHR